MNEEAKATVKAKTVINNIVFYHTQHIIIHTYLLPQTGECELGALSVPAHLPYDVYTAQYQPTKPWNR